MRPILIAALAAIAAWAAGHGLARSAVDSSTGTAPAMELVVFEHPDCAYCPAFRNSIAPRYQGSPQAAEAPLRFVDIVTTDTSRYGLRAPITMVPTAVLVKDGREVDRIAGYWGPDNFLKMVAYIRSKAE
jgi:thioredoxin-related protein